MRRELIVWFLYQAEDGIRDLVRSRGLGDVYKRQEPSPAAIVRSNSADTVYGTRVLITKSTTKCTTGKTFYEAICSSGCGGVAYVGVFDWYRSTTSPDSYYQPALVFQNGTGAGAKNGWGPPRPEGGGLVRRVEQDASGARGPGRNSAAAQQPPSGINHREEQGVAGLDSPLQLELAQEDGGIADVLRLNCVVQHHRFHIGAEHRFQVSAQQLRTGVVDGQEDGLPRPCRFGDRGCSRNAEIVDGQVVIGERQEDGVSLGFKRTREARAGGRDRDNAAEPHGRF